MPTVPVVDLGTSATPGMRRGLAGVVTDTLRRSSCAWVDGHGVPPVACDGGAAGAYRAAVTGVAATVVALVTEHLHLLVGDHRCVSSARCAALVARYEGAGPPIDEGRAGPAASRSRRAPGWITVRAFEGPATGLEVRHAGRWVAVRPRPGALFVHTGELLERWTNGVLPVASVRAAGPTAPGTPWRSIALHHQPPPATVVAPARSCVGHAGPRYAPVRWAGLASGAEWIRFSSSAPADAPDDAGPPSARTASMVSASAASLSGR